MAKMLRASVAICALLAACVSAFPSPSAAVAATKVVQWHDLDSVGLQEYRGGCSAGFPGSPAATPLGLKAGTLGSHSIGWQMPYGYEVGALARIHHPESLSVFAGDVFIPSGSGSGNAVAFYYNTDLAPGYWFGYRNITFNQSGFGTYSLAALSFSWTYIDSTSATPVGSNTIAGFTGGDPGQGAYVGILAGCEGQPFYFDNLRVADNFDQTVYDFEGAPSGSRLQWSTDGKKVKGGNLAVGYGSKFWMLGDSYDAYSGGDLTGQGALLQKTYGSASWVPVGTGGYDPRHYAAFKVSPTRETSYWFATDGNDNYDSSASGTVTVRVGTGVSGRVNDLSLRPGQRAVITGKIKPGNRGTKVSLQRRTGGWATVGTTRTGSGGRFSIGVTARQAGKLVLRLSVASNDGNLGTKTNSVTIEVSPKPKPKPPNPGGGGSNPSTTEPEVEPATGGTSAPGPDDRLFAKPTLHLPPLVPVAPQQPTCTGPGPHPLVPCPPARLG